MSRNSTFDDEGDMTEEDLPDAKLPVDVIVLDGWGEATVEEVRAVCWSVAECFGRAIDERPVGPLQVEYDPDGPITLYERAPNGRIRVQLSAHDRYWAQFVYQFGHEFIHVLSDYRL